VGPGRPATETAEAIALGSDTRIVRERVPQRKPGCEGRYGFVALLILASKSMIADL
jgi:hypothetical protein